ncbi:MAG: PEP-CTERM sorting domain-containing protein [Planctomycetota bacterium]
MIRTSTRLLLATSSLTFAVGPLAHAGEIRDFGEAGTFFAESADNMAIYNSFFEVQFAPYDGNGETDESEKSTASIIYNSFKPGTGVPAGELFTNLELQLTTWDGRSEFDEQTPADIYSASISDNGVDFSPLDLTFLGEFPNSTDGFTANTATAEGFESQYVKIDILARTEDAGSGFNDPWSAHIEEILLITALPGVSGGVVGDYDDSGTVEQGDLNLVLNNWGSDRPFDPNGDPFADLAVNQEELNRVLNNWGSSSTPSFSGSAVPEPASLLGLAALGCFALRRRHG